MDSMPRRKLLVLLLVPLLILVAAGLAWWAARPPVVTVVEVRAAPLVRTLLFSARVAAASRVEIGATVTGRVREVAVAEGESVQPGQLLLRLESEELQAALEQAQAGERQAQARLAGLRSTGRSTAQAAVAQADSVLRAAQAELQRTRELVARGFVSPARLDEAERAVAVAQAQRSGALAQQAATAEQGTEVAQAQAQLALARSAVTAARARLEQAQIVSPAAARVLLREVEPGQIVQPGRALLSLALAGPTRLVAQVDERFLEQLQVGQPASVLADAFPERPFAASVWSIAPLVDAQRGAVEVKLSLPQAPPAFLREDMTLSVQVETGRVERALVVPLQALVGERSATGGTVHVAHDGRVEARRVRLGLATLEAAEVVEGLAAGELVLTASSPPPGARVRVSIAPPAPLPARMPTAGAGEAGAALGNAMGR